MSYSTRRVAYLCLIAVVLGLAGGAASWLLLKLIGLLTNLALLHRVAWNLPSLRDFHPGLWLVPTAMLGGLAVALLAKWAPVIRGHGIPEAMEAVLVRQSRVAPRTAVAKPVSAALAIGTGGPFGAEGPIIVTAGSLGSLIGQALHVSPNERKILLAAGAAAGMAATFGAPLASIVLAIELLLFEFSLRAIAPLAVAASVAAGVHAWYAGSGPLFSMPPHDFSGLSQLPVFALLGILTGLLAVVICKGLYVVEGAYRRLPIGPFWHPIIGAALFACIGLAVPRALGVGYDVIDDALAARLAVGTLALLCVAKLVMWWFALGSGTSGGTLAPVLLVGASFGGLYYAAVHQFWPSLHVSESAIVLVAMAAAFGASTRATLTAIVFAFELTRDYDSMLPLIGAVILADLVSGALLDHGLMTEKLARRGLDVPRTYAPDPLASTRVAAAMQSDVDTIPADATVRTARRLVADGAHGSYPVVEDGRCVGIVSRADTVAPDVDPLAPVGKIASEDVVTVAPDTTLLHALEVMVAEHVDHLPVIAAHGELVGILTRSDVLRARADAAENEVVQTGWVGRLSRSRARATSPEASRPDPPPAAAPAGC